MPKTTTSERGRVIDITPRILERQRPPRRVPSETRYAYDDRIEPHGSKAGAVWRAFGVLLWFGIFFSGAYLIAAAFRGCEGW